MWIQGFLAIFVLCVTARSLPAQTVITNDPPQYGPYNGVFLRGGDGLKKSILEHDSVLRAESAWSLYCWIRFDEPRKAPTLIAGIGDPTEEFPRYLALDEGKLSLWMGEENTLSGAAAITPGKWHLLAATFDGGTFRLYSDGEQVANGTLVLGSVSPVIEIAPPVVPGTNGQHFGGKIASLVLLRQALGADAIKHLSQKPEDFSLVEFEDGSKSWPVQTKGQAGYRAPQDPSEMPRSKAPFSSCLLYTSRCV